VPGCDPQQVVSPGPGRDWAAFPVRLEVAAIFFSVLELPQSGQAGCWVDDRANTSPSKWQSRHVIS
jgi:hypothetical protein